MTLPELHALLDRLGIVLSVRGDRLRWAAPPGAMTPEVVAALATHKPALLRLLAGEPSAPWPLRPAELAEWPVEWRARWGLLANALQDQAIPWPEHERQAFDQIKVEMGRPRESLPDPQEPRKSTPQ
jgi:hypothetical protein